MVSHHPAKFRGHTNVVVKIWYFVEGQDSAALLKFTITLYV